MLLNRLIPYQMTERYPVIITVQVTFKRQQDCASTIQEKLLLTGDRSSRPGEVEQRKLAGLISLRPQVRILPSQSVFRRPPSEHFFGKDSVENTGFFFVVEYKLLKNGIYWNTMKEKVLGRAKYGNLLFKNKFVNGSYF